MAMNKNDMSILGKLFKKNDGVSNAAIAPEIYRSVHVMRDDIDEMEGRPKESFPGSSSETNPSQAGNPFLGTASETPVPDSPSGKQTVTSPVFGTERKKTLIFGSIVVLILIIVSSAVYLFLRGGDEPTMIPETQPEAVEQNPAPIQQESPSVPKDVFSVGMPNYLQIDPESDTATPDGIFKKLSDTADKVNAMGTSDPVEFLIRDMNNNPIAFSRFSYLAKLSVPEETLALIDESFSLYFVPDGGGIRFALSLQTKDADKLAASVSGKESSLPTWFGRLLYDPAIRVPAAVSFRSGTYGTIATKFAVVDEAKNYSFDYAFIGKQWVIGTSKDSFRAALGEIAMESLK